MKKIIILLIAAIATISTSIAQQLSLAGVFGNNMVLQQDSNVELWGWNEPLGTVEIAADWGGCFTTITDNNGRWRAKLSTPIAKSGDNIGHTISFKGKNNTLTLTDVLIGDVWICSGQSNMGYSMGATSNTRGVVDADAEILLADYPQIRLFQVPQNPQSEEVEIMPNASWSKCTPAKVRYYSAIAYYFARKVHEETGIPVGIITTAFGSSRCESWTKKEVLLADPILKEKFYDPYVQNPTAYNPIQTSPTLLYNGMVAPIKKFTIKGLLWYQGEGNSGQPDVYPRLWSAMVNNFRLEWGQGNFPVYYVQLPQYSKGTSWAAFRNAQTTLLTVPNTGMAVSIDLNDIAPDDIHPMVKKPIGERLALWALAKDYGKNILFSGPLLDQIAFSGNKAVVKFQQSTIGTGIKTHDNNNVREFEIAGANKVYYQAVAVIVGNSIELTSNQVSQPQYVRYAHSPTPNPNLINHAGFPVVPFNTETWNYNVKISADLNSSIDLETYKILKYIKKNDGIEINFGNMNEITNIQLINACGSLLFTLKTNPITACNFVPISKRGVYILHVVAGKKSFSHKILF